jgi:DNA-binding IclR family transcriptional regulator
MKTKTRIAAIALSLIGIVGAQFAVVTSAEAKSAKCVAVAVPGQPGTFVMTCSTGRP